MDTFLNSYFLCVCLMYLPYPLIHLGTPCSNTKICVWFFWRKIYISFAIFYKEVLLGIYYIHTYPCIHSSFIYLLVWIVLENIFKIEKVASKVISLKEFLRKFHFISNEFKIFASKIAFYHGNNLHSTYLLFFLTISKIEYLIYGSKYKND